MLAFVDLTQASHTLLMEKNDERLPKESDSVKTFERIRPSGTASGAIGHLTESHRTISVGAHHGFLALSSLHCVHLDAFDWATTAMPRVVLWLPPRRDMPEEASHSQHGDLALLPLITDQNHTGQMPPEVRPLAYALTPDLARLIRSHVAHRLMHGCERLDLRGLTAAACTASTQHILQALHTYAPLPLELPLISDSPIASIAAQLRESPADNRPLSAYAHEAGVSTKTVQRLFQRLTDMSFSSYRSAARLQRAMERICELGSPHVDPREVGYASPHSLTQAFRMHFGMTPVEFCRSTVGGVI